MERLRHQTTTKQQEYDRLKQMAAVADETRRKEAAEIARREAALAELNANIEAMRKRLGTAAVRSDDSLDVMLAMVQQKEEQEKKLEELRRQREEEERQRQNKISRLKREREKEIIEKLRPEVEKYKKIVASKYGKNIKSDAWKALIAKCPPGWADGVAEGDFITILIGPYERELLNERSRRKAAQIAEERRRQEEIRIAKIEDKNENAKLRLLKILAEWKARKIPNIYLIFKRDRFEKIDENLRFEKISCD